MKTLRNPTKSKNTDFIEIVKTSGCIKLIELMLQNGAVYMNLYEMDE